MSKSQARIQARRYSARYNTFYCGKEWKDEPKFEIEQTVIASFWLQRKDGKYDGLHFRDDFGNHVELDFGKLAVIIAEEDLQ